MCSNRPCQLIHTYLLLQNGADVHARNLQGQVPDVHAASLASQPYPLCAALQVPLDLAQAQYSHAWRHVRVMLEAVQG